MLTSPLLSAVLLQSLADLIKKGKTDEVVVLLRDLPLEEKIHYLRYLYHKLADKDIPPVYAVWYSFLPREHVLNTEHQRNALYRAGQWWDAFDEIDGRSGSECDELEQVLEALGTTSVGREFLRWVALSPSVQVQEGKIGEEHRRGAIISLARYDYNRPTELFLARHLDDWTTIQVDVIEILAALKSRVLARLAPWYSQHDVTLREVLAEYGLGK